MWLLNASTYRLHNFLGEEVPQYAILSHRWEEQEVLFSEMQDCRLVEDGSAALLAEEEQIFPLLGELRRYKMQKLESKKGWAKVVNLCKRALEDGLYWAWIDTACIQKLSSAELQESINSMFKWYQRAHKCFVYMSDVPSMAGSHDERLEAFRRSKWFTRAWTLQELLAPEPTRIVFFDAEWGFIGSIFYLDLDISKATGIPTTALTSSNRKLSNFSIARRFSWSSGRKVTREEDIAYSLLGLFDVNMPLLYGEGSVKAFQRLQHEIIKNATDESIFAWRLGNTCKTISLLASSPEDFAHCSDFIPQRAMIWGSIRPFQLTQSGLDMRAHVLDLSDPNHRALIEKDELDLFPLIEFALPLDCLLQGETVFIPLMRLRHKGEAVFWVGPNAFTARLSWRRLICDVIPMQLSVVWQLV